MKPQTAGEPPTWKSDDPLVILIPVFNDWTALGRLVADLDHVLAEHGIAANLMIVDDGSTTDPGEELPTQGLRALRRIEILGLRRNLGHQRAIAIGLAYIEDTIACQAVVVMDGDGEDDPRDVPRLLERYRLESGRTIVFAERTRRSESRAFRIFYALYKLAHYLLTGRGVRVGNFSVIPRSRLTSLVVVAEMWNHYAAAAFKSRQPCCMIPTHRARRLHGQSTMNYVNLVVHGLSAISVYSETVGVRLLIVALTLILLSLTGVLATVAVRLATDVAIPGWATSTVGILLVLLLQAMMLAFLFSFTTLVNRQGATFLPRRDYSYFIGQLRPVNLQPCPTIPTSDLSSNCSPQPPGGSPINVAISLPT